MNRENSATEDIKRAINDNEHSIGEEVPGSPFAIVALSYIGILGIVALVIAAVIWLV